MAEYYGDVNEEFERDYYDKVYTSFLREEKNHEK